MSLEDRFLDFLDALGTFDFSIVMYFVLFTIVLLWFFVVFGVWTDSRERSTNIGFSIFSVIIVAPFNLLGLIIYLIIRPKETVESLFWADLERRYLIHETADLTDCRDCGYQLSPDFNVCPQCAKHVKNACPECEEMVNVDWKFCPTCSYQMLKRRAPEKELTQEVMEKNLEGTKEQAVAAVENNQIRYKKRSGVLALVGFSVIKTFSRIKGSILKGFKKVASVKPRRKSSKKKESTSTLRQNSVEPGSVTASTNGKKNEDNSNDARPLETVKDANKKAAKKKNTSASSVNKRNRRKKKKKKRRK